MLTSIAEKATPLLLTMVPRVRPLHQALLDHMSRYVTRNLKNRSHKILRLWTKHCEYIVAQKCRRGQQMATLYTKLWDDRALRELFHRFRKQMQRNTKGLLLGAVGIVTFDWDAQRITYDSLRPHLNEIDFVRQLKRETIFCKVCARRKIIDGQVDGIDYCNCTKEMLLKAPPSGSGKAKDKFSEWKPYLERKNMVVWRREEKPGMFAYKVHASYSDITAEDFLHVQTDTTYRKQWDKSAIALDVVDVDPKNIYKSHIIYWEMQWPKLFANRDYVYQRRFVVDCARKLIVIASIRTEHPACPPLPSKQRVQEYWSYMVIKPTTTFKKPGVEYVLTYFDNPGIVVPPTITNWVAQKQMPDFLNKLYMATVAYAKTRPRLVEEEEKFCDYVSDPGFEYPPERDMWNLRRPPKDDSDDDDGDDGSTSDGRRLSNCIDEVDLLEDTDTVPRKTSWWSYFTPYYYFYSS